MKKCLMIIPIIMASLCCYGQTSGEPADSLEARCRIRTRCSHDPEQSRQSVYRDDAL